MCGLRFVRRFVRRFSLRRLKGGSRKETHAARRARHVGTSDRRGARHVGTSDASRAATAIRMCGLRFVRRFVRRFSLRRLKSGSRQETHAARRARHVGTSDESRAATAIRMCGLRFVRRFVRRFSLRRLKGGSRKETHAARRARHVGTSDRRGARRVGTSDASRAATAIRMCGLRFVRRFVRRFSLRRLKGGSRKETHAARHARHVGTSGQESLRDAHDRLGTSESNCMPPSAEMSSGLGRRRACESPLMAA